MRSITLLILCAAELACGSGPKSGKVKMQPNNSQPVTVGDGGSLGGPKARAGSKPPFFVTHLSAPVKIPAPGSAVTFSLSPKYRPVCYEDPTGNVTISTKDQGTWKLELEDLSENKSISIEWSHASGTMTIRASPANNGLGYSPDKLILRGQTEVSILPLGAMSEHRYGTIHTCENGNCFPDVCQRPPLGILKH